MNAQTVTLRPAVLCHLVKTCIHLPIACFFSYGSVLVIGETRAEQDSLAALGLLALLLVPGILCALTASRNIIALFRQPRMQLTPEGIDLESWDGVFFLGFFMPWYRMKIRQIPWDGLKDLKVFRYSVNMIPVSSEVQLYTSQGLVRINSDLFEPSSQRIQTMILDYVHTLVVEPVRTASRLPEFQQRRWEQPFVFPTPPNRPWLWITAIILALGVVSYATFVSTRTFDGGDWPTFCVLVLSGVAILHGRFWWECSRSRRIELRAEGLAIGPSPRRLQVIPWTQIRFARRHTDEQVTSRIEVRTLDGKTHYIRIADKALLDTLCGLIDPEPARVAQAIELAARNPDLETASAAAGIAQRPPIGP